MLSTVLIHAAAGVTTICAAAKTVLIHEPSSKPRPSAPRMSASPAVVIRAFRVEMNGAEHDRGDADRGILAAAGRRR